jgi:hypothetical protein
MHRQRKNIRSTKIETQTDIRPPSNVPNKRTHKVYTKIISVPRHELPTDLTGRFPVRSSRGNQYLLVAYEYDSNGILIEPVKNRSGEEHLRAYNKIYKYLTEQGFTPEHQRLDNEASAAYKSNM